MPGLQNNSGNKNTQRNGNKNSSRRRYFRPKNGSNSTAKNKTNNQLKVRELKFHLHGTESSKKAEIFERIKEDIVSKIKRTFSNAMNIAQSVKEGTRVTYSEPAMAEPTETDPIKLAREERKVSMKYQIDYEYWIKKEERLRRTGSKHLL